MSAELKENFDVEAELVRSSGGIFNVEIDDKLVFSKHETGRFPHPGEVTEIIHS